MPAMANTDPGGTRLPASLPAAGMLKILPIIGVIGLLVSMAELIMRNNDWPRTIISGWSATTRDGPFNQLGLRGRPFTRGSSDFVVVITGGGAIECVECPKDETLDLILERAIQQYNPRARVVSLGSRGYAQDQQFLILQRYFARERADLVIAWTALDDDVPGNTFRSGHPGPGPASIKPTFALFQGVVLPPTEQVGQTLYKMKLAILLRMPLGDPDRAWERALPPPTPGEAVPSAAAKTQLHVDEKLEDQRSAWSLSMNPRPARVAYGMALTSALLQQMQELTRLHGARFTVAQPPSESRGKDGPAAIEHAGQWFLADPAARDAAAAEITAPFETIKIGGGGDQTASTRAAPPATERQLMARLAEGLKQRNMLTPLPVSRARH